MSQVRRLKWRTFISICAGLLLPLPLLLLLSLLLQPERKPVEPAGQHISPMLDIEQRTRLMTYGRSCQSSAECDPPLGCLYAFRYGRSYCTDSQCTTDAQCPEGQVCRKLATKEQGPLVRICIPVGVRQEGENCVEVPEDQRSACAPGLLCVGKNGWCARPCHLGAPAQCPEGFFCADTTPEPACLPTCEKRGCPEGQQCLQFREGSSQCMQVYGDNCQQRPCPGGARCHMLPDPPYPGKAWLWCVELCGKDSPPCSAGKVCDGWKCIPACDPQGPAVCGEGFRCRQQEPDSLFGCRPDW
jgi:Cys-rich repeat protein